MAFLDELRTFIEQPGFARSISGAEMCVYRNLLHKALEERAREGLSSSEVRSLHQRWSHSGDAFTETLITGLRQGMAYDADDATLRSYVEVGLKLAVGLAASTGSMVSDLELERLVRRAQTSGSSAHITAGYAVQVGAVRRVEGRLRATRIGELVLELSDRDAFRWLLAVELRSSLGDSDRWRLSQAGAVALVKYPKGGVPWAFQDTPTFSTETLERLETMGLVELTEDGQLGMTLYNVLPHALPLLEEVAVAANSPFTLLAEALLDDETTSVLGKHGSLAPRVQVDGAAAATTRHARMVAHEIRNALVPVQSTIEELFRDLDRAGFGHLSVPHRAAIDEGLERVFDFVKTMVRVAALGAEPEEAFDVVVAVEDAMAAMAPETGLQVSFDHPDVVPSLVGRRNRFTLAVINLLRNASQSRPGGQICVCVEVQTPAERAELVVLVDDDGPGVPVKLRTLIFERGFSSRAGGSGEGLALVREVVEREMGGQARCELSPLGGARFVLRFPLDRQGRCE